jgi:helicase MOV-10
VINAKLLINFLILYAFAFWLVVTLCFYWNQKWSNFQLKNVILESLHEAEIKKRSNQHKYYNRSVEKDDKIFVVFEFDSIPEKRPFLLSRDLVYARPSGKNVEPFRVSFRFH